MGKKTSKINSLSSCKVSILMGSISDMPVMEEASKTLKIFSVKNEIKILSAHRTPGPLRRYVQNAVNNGVSVFIVGAGGAAHLAGSVAALCFKPVIGVPLSSTSLNGLDALLSTVQMPKGVPVATVAIGNAGAANAALLAVQILAVSNPELANKYRDYKIKMEKDVLAKNRCLLR